jgi:large subunit ribosomal protein L21
MPTYAIVESGGKQYRVEKGQSLLVDRISEDEGAKVPLRAVMFRSDDDTVIGAKDLEKVKVEARIAGHERGEKIRVFKYKAKKGYRKRHGHRSELTRLEVTEVAMLTRKPAAKKKAEDAGEMPKAGEAAPEKAPAEKPEAEKKAKAAKKPAANGLPEGIGKPATRALEEAGLDTLEKVAAKTEAELLEVKGVGPKAVEALTEALADAGLSLEQSDEKETD